MRMIASKPQPPNSPRNNGSTPSGAVKRATVHATLEPFWAHFLIGWNGAMKTETKAKFRRFFRCRVFWITVAVLVGYSILGWLLPRQPFLEFIRILAATTSLVVAVSFSADAWESVTAEEPDRTDSLVVGIFLLSVSGFITNFWLLLFRLADTPDWMLHILTWGFGSAMIAAIGNVLHVWAPGVLRKSPDGEDVPPARLRAVGVAAALGVFATLVVLATQPNAVWLVEAMRPYLR
jgi:hypothetical protein